MDNRETPLKFVGRKKVPKGISNGTGFNGAPTEQQKYYIYKNYVEPALLLKNQQQESEVVKAIKEALGVQTVVNNSSIVDSFGFEDEGAQQKVKKEAVEIKKKLRKEKLDKRIEEGKKNKASSLLKSAVGRKKAQDKLIKTKIIYDENDKRFGYDPQSYFKGRPTTQERTMKAELKERKRNQANDASLSLASTQLFNSM